MSYFSSFIFTTGLAIALPMNSDLPYDEIQEVGVIGLYTDCDKINKRSVSGILQYWIYMYIIISMENVNWPGKLYHFVLIKDFNDDQGRVDDNLVHLSVHCDLINDHHLIPRRTKSLFYHLGTHTLVPKSYSGKWIWQSWGIWTNQTSGLVHMTSNLEWLRICLRNINNRILHFIYIQFYTVSESNLEIGFLEVKGLLFFSIAC